MTLVKESCHAISNSLYRCAFASSGDDVTQRFGLAWDRKATRWGVLPIPSKVNTEIDHEIFRGFPESIELVDELYWNLGGDLNETTVLATSQAGTSIASKGPPTSNQLDGKSWPLFLFACCSARFGGNRSVFPKNTSMDVAVGLAELIGKSPQVYLVQDFTQ